jgi:hypothetical protein
MEDYLARSLAQRSRAETGAGWAPRGGEKNNGGSMALEVRKTFGTENWGLVKTYEITIFGRINIHSPAILGTIRVPGF